MPIYGLPFSDKQLFVYINVVLPGWILLAVAPRWRYSQTISAICALFAAALYTGLMATLIVHPPGSEKLDFSEMFTLEGVRRLLSREGLALPCWVHYAAFDLWVGRWIAADAVQRGVPQLLLAPCLGLTLFVGPVGLVAYWLVRTPFNKASKAKAA